MEWMSCEGKSDKQESCMVVFSYREVGASATRIALWSSRKLALAKGENR